MWFDVGVFKTLYCEVTHYFLPSEEGDMASTRFGRNSSDSEVCLWCCFYTTIPNCNGFQLWLCFMSALSVRQWELPGPHCFKDHEKQELASGVTYKFRVAGLNSRGLGNFSPVSEFKTCQPGFPGAPSAVKITKVQSVFSVLANILRSKRFRCYVLISG